MTSFFRKFINHSSHPRGNMGKFLLKMMNIGHSPISRWGLQQITWDPEWHVLDIGCGGGANIARMLEFCPKGIVNGIDISEVSVAYSAEKNREELNKRCFIKMGTANDIPFDDESMDLVTAFETIYFWGNLEQSFVEVRRVLRPGGTLLICNEVGDPSDTTWSDIVDGMIIEAPHELQQILRECGYTDIFIRRKKNSKAFCILAHKPWKIK